VVDRVPVPATLLAALADLVKWLDVTKIPSMVIGGVDPLEFARRSRVLLMRHAESGINIDLQKVMAAQSAKIADQRAAAQDTKVARLQEQLAGIEAALVKPQFTDQLVAQR
jgi:hypothetical protein